MGFIVEPYSYFIVYEIIDLEKASLLLPDYYEEISNCKLIVNSWYPNLFSSTPSQLLFFHLLNIFI